MPAADTIFPIVVRHNVRPSECPLLGQSQTRSVEERIYSRSLVRMGHRCECVASLNCRGNKQRANAISESRETTMFTNAKLALCVAAVLGSASAAQTAPQHPTTRETQSIVQRQVSRS